MEVQNYGIKIEVKDTDYISGFFSPLKYEVRHPSGDWEKYLPTKERQSPPETFACVSFSHLNTAPETQINFLIENKLFSKEAIDYFNSAGYIDENGKFNCSDKFLAIMSGTTREGNTLQKVADTVRKYGLLPDKDLPFGNSKTWESYHNPAQITEAMKVKAKKILDYIDLNYEWIVQDGDGSDVIWTLTRHLKHAPIQVAIPICASFRAGVDPMTTCSLRAPQHAVMVYRIDNYIRILDQYVMFQKNLTKDYPVPYAMKIVVTSKTDSYVDIPIGPAPTLPSNPTPSQFQLWVNKAVEWLKDLSAKLVKGIRGY